MGTGTARTLVTRGTASRVPAQWLLAVDGYAARQDSSRGIVGPRKAAMEGLVVRAKFWRGKRVLVTGHTGFKGSWLALWLTELGAHVTGCSLPPPSSPNHWDLLGLDVADERLDIRDAAGLAALMRSTRPEVVFHLAAQSLVRRSYRDPLETWSTNVM